jgi:alpha-tubulin suppressor-like RCC1 family protein
MPNFYNYIENGVAYAFDDVFVPAEPFRQGNLWGWGANSSGQLADNTSTQRNTPVTTFAGGTNWKQVSFAKNNGTSVKTDGTLWTWGSNSYGQIGNNTSGANRSTPVTTFAGETNWKQVACGYQHNAAIKTDGTLWIWGRNNFGQLGDNTTTNRLTPVTTFAGGTNWKQVACGNHTAAIKTDGTLWTWGRNNFGQLADNTSTQRNTPVTTFAGGTNWKQVSCGGFHTAAIKTDGTLWNWGGGSKGVLGTNDTIGISTPVTTFAGGTNWKQVTCSQEYTLAIKTDGTLWSWGANVGLFGGIEGFLGDNTSVNRSTPVTTFAGGTNWKQVACGERTSFAVKTDGTLWTWGYSGLGNGTQFGVAYTPITTFAGGTNWKQATGGQDNGAALTYIDDYQ